MVTVLIQVFLHIMDGVASQRYVEVVTFHCFNLSIEEDQTLSLNVLCWYLLHLWPSVQT